MTSLHLLHCGSCIHQKMYLTLYPTKVALTSASDLHTMSYEARTL